MPKKLDIAHGVFRAEVVSENNHSNGISWWLALTIFLILFVCAFYFYSRSKIHQEREQMCWKYMKTGDASVITRRYLHDDIIDDVVIVPK